MQPTPGGRTEQKRNQNTEKSTPLTARGPALGSRRSPLITREVEVGRAHQRASVRPPQQGPGRALPRGTRVPPCWPRQGPRSRLPACCSSSASLVQCRGLWDPGRPPVGGASIGHVAVYNTSLRGHSDSGARGGSLPGRQTTWPRPSTHSLFPECLPRSPEGRQGVRGPRSGRQRPARECAALGFVSVLQACGMKEAIPIGCQGQCRRARGIWGTETVVVCVV